MCTYWKHNDCTMIVSDNPEYLHSFLYDVVYYMYANNPSKVLLQPTSTNKFKA